VEGAGRSSPFVGAGSGPFVGCVWWWAVVVSGCW